MAATLRPAVAAGDDRSGGMRARDGHAIVYVE
jgi:hypothetical protein